jgi:hypothetical protein
MNKLDLLFIVDITASMGGLIRDAQNKMKDMLKDLSESHDLNLKVGLSLYRDHASQGDSFVTVTFDLMDNDKIQGVIDKIRVGGGGDAPEAVIDGVINGMEEMSWREGSRRIAFLIADAPAHGMVNSEPCCQCGKTWGDAVVSVEKEDAVVYSIVLGGDRRAGDNLRTIANYTGGFLIETDNAMEAIVRTLKDVMSEDSIESKVLSEIAQTEDVEGLLKVSR